MAQAKTYYVQVRVSLVEKQMLAAIASTEGESQSVTLRRLIRRAYFGPGGLWERGPQLVRQDRERQDEPMGLQVLP